MASSHEVAALHIALSILMALPSATGNAASGPAIARTKSFRPSRWVWRGILLLFLLLSSTLFAWRAAWILVSEDAAAPAEYVVLMGCELDREGANSFVGDNSAQILLIGKAPRRLESLGIRPARTDEERRFLESCNVNPALIHLLPSEARNDWQQAAVLRQWLQDHPEAHLTVVCHRFDSRRLRIILDRVVGPDASRVHIAAPRNRRYDETNWWRVKQGIVDLSNGLLSLSYVTLVGEGDTPDPMYDFDAYERSLHD
jgi:uncharacterized SAM-binding protein YcdF (DUF218 family)